MKRYIILIAAVVMQMCFGSIYAWSIFATQLQRHHGLTAYETSMVFSVCILVFTAVVLATGRVQDRFGPRWVATAGGAMHGAAYLLAGLSGGSYGMLLLCIGVLNGVGIACGYVCAVATPVKWFPQHKGLVAGLAAAGYGGSAVVFAPVLKAALRVWPVLTVLRGMGVCCGVLAVTCGLLLTTPGAARGVTGRLRLGGVLRDRQFWRLMLAFFCSTMGGLMIIPNLERIGLSFGRNETIAAGAIVALALGNASGRILWGFVYDGLGGARVILASLVANLIALLVFQGAGASAVLFLEGAGLVGFCYGGCFALYAPRVAELYGVEHLGAVYSMLLLAHGLSGPCGARLNKWLLEMSGSYRSGLLVVAGVLVIGLGIYVALGRRGARGVAA